MTIVLNFEHDHGNLEFFLKNVVVIIHACNGDQLCTAIKMKRFNQDETF